MPEAVKGIRNRISCSLQCLTHNLPQTGRGISSAILPFKKKRFGFSNKMISRSLDVLNSLEFSLDIEPFDDYKYLKDIKLDKFLVTTGITKLQIAKIDGLKIKNDFKEIIIDDPTINGGGKTEVFSAIMQKYNYHPEELLIIGDNPESEIKAGIELGINTLLIDRKRAPSGKNKIICNFKEVINLIEE